MSATGRSYLSLHPALKSVRAYREMLRGYSSEELEDIYFHIDLLQEPLRYRLVQMEMERRGLQPDPDEGRTPVPKEWIERAPGFGGRPHVRSVYIGLLLFALTATLMGLMLLPLWLFAVPFRFSGVQASLVYLVLLPVMCLVGLTFGMKTGGWRLRSLVVPGAVLLSIWLFYACGGIDAIMKPLFRAGGAPGGLFSGF